MPAPELARKLSRFDAAMIVVSGIIGVGIVINPNVVAGLVKTPFLILAVWVAGGLIALAGAFVFAELATVVPRVGGQYAYFREAFGPLVGFLHGWSLLFIIQSGATAAVAVACGRYAVRASAVAAIAIALLAALVFFHALRAAGSGSCSSLPSARSAAGRGGSTTREDDASSNPDPPRAASERHNDLGRRPSDVRSHGTPIKMSWSLVFVAAPFPIEQSFPRPDSSSRQRL